MIIQGLQKTTLIDYPGKIACTVFLAGCNFRCPWCYSSDLVFSRGEEISPASFFSFLDQRKNQLEGVVICGGEPTINSDLPDFCSKVKQKGYSVKLDTNGSNPVMLKELVESGLIDYVAMDVKAPQDKYTKAIGVNFDIAKIEKSISFLKQNKVDYEFRTTIHPFLNKNDLIKIAEWIRPAKKYYLQPFKAMQTLKPEVASLTSLVFEEIEKAQKEIASFFEICEVR